MPDSTLIEAAARIVAERGAAQTRLSDVAAASGFAAATLVQRFGSRERLLGAVGAAQVARIQLAFARTTPSFVEQISGALYQLHQEGHIAFLLTHQETAAAYSLELRKWLGQTLAAAIEGGQLPRCDVALHARRIQLGYFGQVLAARFEGVPLDTAALSSMLTELLADFM